MAMPATLSEASLTAAERRALERWVERLREALGDELDSVWLYGSRARGEPPHEESDVDLLVLVRDPKRIRHHELVGLMWDAQQEAGALGTYFSIKVYDREWLEGRREIRSFFIQEVDRDKIVLAGDP